MRKRKQTNLAKQIQFKKRTAKTNRHLALLFGFFGLYCKYQVRIEGLYVKKLKLKFRKSFKKRKKQHRPRVLKKVLWVRYKPNTSLTRKSKNARMGSGKGKMSRKAFVVPGNQTIVEFRHAKPKFLRQVQNHIKRRWAINTSLFRPANLLSETYNWSMQTRPVMTICGACWLQTKYSFFSNLPYSAFNTRLTAVLPNIRIKLTLKKFKWRSTLVTLRAPKHFKVGRQHYSQGRRTILLYLINKNLNFIIYQGGFTQLAANIKNIQKSNLPVQPLSSIKTITTWITIKSILSPL